LWIPLDAVALSSEETSTMHPRPKVLCTLASEDRSGDGVVGFGVFAQDGSNGQAHLA
jgi:hypothetical protein